MLKFDLHARYLKKSGVVDFLLVLLKQVVDFFASITERTDYDNNCHKPQKSLKK